MLVKDLIDLLQHQNENAAVVFLNRELDWEEVGLVSKVNEGDDSSYHRFASDDGLVELA